MGGKRGESRKPKIKKGVEEHRQTVPVHIREQHAPHISLHARCSSFGVSDSGTESSSIPIHCSNVVSIQTNAPRSSSTRGQGSNNSKRGRCCTLHSACHSSICHSSSNLTSCRSNELIFISSKQTHDGFHHPTSSIQEQPGRNRLSTVVSGSYTVSYYERLLVLGRHFCEYLHLKSDGIRNTGKENGKKFTAWLRYIASGYSDIDLSCILHKLGDVWRSWMDTATRIIPYAVLTGGVVTSMFLLANPASAAQPVTPPIPDYFHSFLYWLLGWIFRLVCGVVYTLPIWIFTSTGFIHTFSLVTVLSISLIGLKGVWKGISMGYAKQEASNKEVGGIVWRLVLVMIGIGFLPMGLDVATRIINRVTLAIGRFGFSQVTNMPDISSLNNAVITQSFTDIDVFGMAIFDALLLWNAIPLLFQAGRRWVDMAILGVVSPLALSCFVFEDTKHYGRTWWNGVKRIGIEQIWQVSLLAFLLLLMFGSKQITGPADVLVKVLLLIGGLSRMKQPPTFMPRGEKSKMGRSIQKRITDTAKKLVIPKKS